MFPTKFWEYKEKDKNLNKDSNLSVFSVTIQKI